MSTCENNNIQDKSSSSSSSSSFTEIFGDLNFREKPEEAYHRRSESFSSLNSESLQICTEGLGSESLYDVEDRMIDFPGSYNKMGGNGDSGYEYRKGKGKGNGERFPPPISCIGRTGKPCVCFQSYRQDGRFVLKEMKIPTHERLHATREDGRLRLCFVQPSDLDEDDAGVVIDDEDGEEKAEGEGEGRKEETEVKK